MREAILIDAGPGSFAAVQPIVEKENLHIVAGLLTHGHFDHVWDSGRFASQWQVPFYLAPADEAMVTDPERWYESMWSIPLQALSDFDPFDGAPTKPLPESGVFAGISVRTIPAPGHSEGSTLIMVTTETGEELCFSGDVLFAGAIGRTDLRGGDHQAMQATLRDVVRTLDPELRVFPGHGTHTTIKHELATNPYLR